MHAPFRMLPWTTDRDLPNHPLLQSLLSATVEGGGGGGGFDLFVSELLGSFGGNEFLPELVAATKRVFLHPSSVVVPAAYTNIVAPVSAPHVHQIILSKSTPKTGDGQKPPVPSLLDTLPHTACRPFCVGLVPPTCLLTTPREPLFRVFADFPAAPATGSASCYAQCSWRSTELREAEAELQTSDDVHVQQEFVVRCGTDRQRRCHGVFGCVRTFSSCWNRNRGCLPSRRQAT